MKKTLIVGIVFLSAGLAGPAIAGDATHGLANFFKNAYVNVNLGNIAADSDPDYYSGFAGLSSSDLDRWAAGIDAGYSLDLWSLNLEYSHIDQDPDSNLARQYEQDRLMLTGSYTISPGINVDGGLGYSWINSNPEDGPSSGAKPDDHALEIGIGTNFTF